MHNEVLDVGAVQDQLLGAGEDANDLADFVEKILNLNKICTSSSSSKILIR